MEIVTARLALRRPEPADLETIFAIHRDPEACRHNPSDLLVTVADAEHLYSRWDDHWRRHGFGYWVVEERGSRKILGFAGLKVVRFREIEVLNLFYRLDPAAWGNAVATEAATAVVSWAGQHLPDWPILARVRPANVASQRVALRAGLSRAEHLDDEGEDGPDWLFVTRWPADRS
ncbi:GNAT family N-acetyltransferase [Amorphoplanes nipponensis]|uniref:GNAT family acetyltransferase n=1 Tax=Actinoplanes nipponensis TaxID=135950 RepID=A0A919JLJ7_9ACTN|nr:GNAT family N-acetyltransferase [Actinoplanes nipponensis]GIE53249.1 GNAT family acetyltransferase [Actinoplanes nipponensis]